jgi:HPt (histidine-containing phosphotransfer) domain-containing protein
MNPTPDDSAVLDLDHLRCQTAGDRGLERDLLVLFDAQCARLRPLMAAGRSPAERADAVHTLKGSARAIGAWRVAAAADRLEAVLRGGGPEPAGLMAGFDAVIEITRRAAAEQARVVAAA